MTPEERIWQEELRARLYYDREYERQQRAAKAARVRAFEQAHEAQVRRAQERAKSVSDDPVYHAAKAEHAWLLRAEGVTYREIGERIGVTQERARQIILRFGGRVSRAINQPRAMQQTQKITRVWQLGMINGRPMVIGSVPVIDLDW